MSITENEDDPSFLALPASFRRRIDNAFDSVASPGSHLEQSTADDLAGGYVAEDLESGPGGFIIEGPCSNPFGTIALSEIPHALSLLGLVPDDDIMDVFKNAAMGWGAQDVRNDGVIRKDWRAVCATLLDGEENEKSGEENLIADEDVEMGEDSDEYQMGQVSDETEEASSDEYEELGRMTSKSIKSHKDPTKSSRTMRLTESQKAQCRQDFGRFFPDIPDSELDQQRITIRDVDRVATLLKENINAEEIMDMLEAFSTSADKSMNLADFEHMMVLAKLV